MANKKENQESGVPEASEGVSGKNEPCQTPLVGQAMCVDVNGPMDLATRRSQVTSAWEALVQWWREQLTGVALRENSWTGDSEYW